MMGQHKKNPVAIAAKNGELPPKPGKLSKAERDRRLYAMCTAAIFGSFFSHGKRRKCHADDHH